MGGVRRSDMGGLACVALLGVDPLLPRFDKVRRRSEGVGQADVCCVVFAEKGDEVDLGQRLLPRALKGVLARPCAIRPFGAGAHALGRQTSQRYWVPAVTVIDKRGGGGVER